MDIRRLSLALLVALALSGGTTYLLYSHVRNQKAAGPPMIKVVAAAHDLNAGTPVTPETIHVIDWPANVKIQGVITTPDALVGRSLIYPVNANQPILESALAAPGSGFGLSVKIPDGMRAVSIRSNDVVGVAGFLYPGSHVDVLLTYKPENNPNPVTQTILQDVDVLTAGQTIEPDPKGKPEQVNVVTLLLGPRDAQKMVLASQQGTIQFVLRNGADQAQPDNHPVLVSQLLNDAAPAAPKAQVVTISKPRPKVQPAQLYSVETIAGDKHIFEKF